VAIRFELGHASRVLFGFPCMSGCSRLQIAQRLYCFSEQAHGFAASVLLGAAYCFRVLARTPLRFELASNLDN
jgi:hypothetical protein